MWFLTAPEELKKYSCKTSLKKAKESLVQRYLSLIYDRMPEPFSSRKLWPVFQDHVWYTGISSNPLLSLAAHSVDINQSSKFVCWVIPVKFARELKAEVLTLPQFRHITDDASDYLTEEQRPFH